MSPRRAPKKRGKAMRFDLVRPCPHCPFRADIQPYLHGERAADIAEALDGSTFACHETTYGQAPVEQHCAGALVMMARADRWGSLQQIAERFGMFARERLDLGAPVFASFADFVRANGGRPRGWMCGLRPGGEADE